MYERSYTPFGRWLHAQMARLDLNLSELGERLELSHAAVSAWMYGRRLPSDENRWRLARVLGVPVDAVYTALGVLPPGEALGLEEETRRLLVAYERMTPGQRDLLNALVDALLDVSRGAERGCDREAANGETG